MRLPTLLLCLLPALAPASAPKEAPGKHAVLVGVTHYEHLDKKHALEGGSNDVALMSDLLQTRFGFPAGNIRVLSEEALKTDRRLLPERANIERELKALAKRA